MEIYTYKNLLDENFLHYLSLIYLYYEVITFKTCDNSIEIRIKIDDLVNDSALKETLKMHPEKQFMLSTKNLEHFHYDLKDSFVKDYLSNVDKNKKHVL